MDTSKQTEEKVLRVVIVEDHPQLCDVLKRMIRASDGLSCSGEFLTGAEALSHICQTHPDVVTLDLSLPDTDGIALLQEIRRHCPQTACILFSGYADESYVELALRAGARGYLHKEDVVELICSIRKVANGEICVSARFAAIAARFASAS